MSKIIETKDGNQIKRVSRWIKIQHNYNPNRRNAIWDYVIDGNGYREGQASFDPRTGLSIDYFVWNGRKWAIEQFLRESYPTMWEEEGKLHWLAGYDGENYFNPIQIEMDEYCEYVRVYEGV